MNDISPLAKITVILCIASIIMPFIIHWWDEYNWF
jgi:hypothetical protein